ncbi:MAG TPA: MFS transporter, partial [Chloroflexia bacterium]|nr:MFS transporter [Chloroflexia bacterium]
MISTLSARKTQGAAATKVRFDGLWRHPDFLKFWAGETVSLFGTQITLLALPLTAVLLLNATPSQMGLLTAIEFVPFLFITLFAGVWSDRKRRRPVLVASNLGRGILLASVPAAALMGWLTIEYLFLVVFLFGIVGVFFEVAYQSFLPSLVEREELVEGNSKLFASASAAEIGGPGLAGLLVGVITAPFALVLDAVSFLVSGGTLWLIRKPEPEPVRQAGRRHILR